MTMASDDPPTAPPAPARAGGVVASVGADDAPWVDVPGGQRRLMHADLGRRPQLHRLDPAPRRGYTSTFGGG